MINIINIMSSIYNIKNMTNFINLNSTLESRIECLEIEVEELKTEIIELKKENQELKKENQELKKEIIRLNIKIDKLEFDKLKSRLITALQDINSYEQLELKLNINKSLIKLRKNRNVINYYIDLNDDDNKIINYKKLYLLKMLESLNDFQQNVLNERYGETFINEIINYLRNNIDYNNDNIDDEIKKDVEYWWTD